jgi:glycosyltransferase involved in cell wall biosynthesis
MKPEASRPLRVWHVGPVPDYGRGGGVDVAAWPLVKAQQAAGAIVSMLMVGAPSSAATAEAANAGIELIIARTARFGRWQLIRDPAIFDRGRPDIVHFHGVFMPSHGQLARKLRPLGIPYVVTPHGGFNFWRAKLKKAVYGALVEKSYLRNAGALFLLSKREKDLALSWIGAKNRVPQLIEIENAIPPVSFGGPQWTLPTRQRLVYLGRFDIFKKGIDRLVDIARNMPEADVFAYGYATGTEVPVFEKLRESGLPENFRFQSPVFDDAKLAALTSASMYVQTSRDDAFPMSIVEAMRLGVPVALTRGCAVSDQIREKDLGLIIPDDPAEAAAVLSAALRDENKLYQWSAAGQKWTAEDLSPESIAERTLAIYRMFVPSV